MKSHALQVALIAVVTSVVTTMLVEQFRDSLRAPERRATAAVVSVDPSTGEPRDEAPAELAEPRGSSCLFTACGGVSRWS